MQVYAPAIPPRRAEEAVSRPAVAGRRMDWWRDRRVVRRRSRSGTAAPRQPGRQRRSLRRAPTADPDHPTAAEFDATVNRLKEYQAVFESH
jgi:hypothetical protein